MSTPIDIVIQADNRRYAIVSDRPEWTVHDTVTGKDIFPTTSGNRLYCQSVCDQDTAIAIADALNNKPTNRPWTDGEFEAFDRLRKVVGQNGGTEFIMGLAAKLLEGQKS